MDLRAYVDHYCERVLPGLWGEPLNAASNAGFFIAAWVIWRMARRMPQAPGAIRTLVGLCLAVGVGSTSFHLTAEVWARTLDIGLIVVFELAFFWCYLRAGAGLSRAATLGALVAFGLVVGYSLRFQDVLHGSVQYVPALGAIAGLGAFHRARPVGSSDLLVAAGIFAVALMLRTIDDPACPTWPYGTHFIWHVLNAVVMYLCMRALLRVRTAGNLHM